MKARYLWSLAALVGAVSFAIALLGVDARATYGAMTTADEPQYLTSALSLANDGNLNISDELLGREYTPFHEIKLNQQTIDLDEDGKRISPHDPLLPLLLAPAMKLGGWVAAKWTLAALSALTAVSTFVVCVKGFACSPGRSAVVVVAFWAGAPMSAYGTQVYPEMPAALLVILAVGSLVGATQSSTAGSSDTTGGATMSQVVVPVLCVIALPWLAVKYAPVAAVLALLLVWRLGVGRLNPKMLGLTVGTWLVAGIVYLALHQLIYGGWTVYVSGDHFVDTGEFSVVGNHPDYFGRSRRLVGLLVDRRFGIAIWHPAWAVAPFAMMWAAVRNCTYAAVAATTFAAGLLTATFVALTMQGWWFPGRQLVVVLPLAVVAVAMWVSQSRLGLVLVSVGSAAGFYNWLVLTNEATSGRRTLIVDHWDVEAFPYQWVSTLSPDGLASGPDPIWSMLVWGLLLVMSMIAGAWPLCQATWASRPWRKDT